MEANKDWIVVWDPQADYWPGALVDHERMRQLAARGVAVLPVEPKLFRLSGVGGFAKREWGAGWPLESAVPRMVAPMTIYATPEYQTFHWIARLMPDPGVDPRSQFEGQLRLATDMSQPGGARMGIVHDSRNPHVDMRKLGALDEFGGWNVGGASYGKPPGDNHYGFALYGWAPGLRVVWAAMSLARM